MLENISDEKIAAAIIKTGEYLFARKRREIFIKGLLTGIALSVLVIWASRQLWA